MVRDKRREKEIHGRKTRDRGRKRGETYSECEETRGLKGKKGHAGMLNVDGWTEE